MTHQLLAFCYICFLSLFSVGLCICINTCIFFYESFESKLQTSRPSLLVEERGEGRWKKGKKRKRAFTPKCCSICLLRTRNTQIVPVMFFKGFCFFLIRDPKSTFTFTCHVSLVSFNLDRFLGSLSFVSFEESMPDVLQNIT